MATTGFNLGEKLLLQGDSRIDSEYTSFGTIINNVLPNVYIVAGLVIFIMVLVGGFMVISNSGDTHQAEEGKKIVTSAIMGLAVLFASYWIIQIVQVVTGVPILNSSL